MTVSDYRELYDRESDRREQLQSAANTPISIVTLLGGGIVLMMKGFESDAVGLRWAFWGGSGIAVGMIATAVAAIVRSIYNYEYIRIPYASDLAKHRELLLDFYRSRGTPEEGETAFVAYLTTRYISAADANAKNNIRRDTFLRRANRFLIYGLCATTVTAIPAGIAMKQDPAKPQDVRIINFRSDGHALIEEWSGQPRSPGIGHGSGGRPAR